MLYTLAVILVVLWLLGLVTSYTMGGFIHALLVIAIVVIVLGLSADEECRDPIVVRHEKRKETSMNKLISLAILAVGIVLVIYGVSASESLSSDISRFFTGSPTDKTIWLLIGGIVAIIIGLGWFVASSTGEVTPNTRIRMS